MSNKSLGNDFENEFAQKLYDFGFWVKILPQNQAGQPADIIAVKNHKAYLIDCKVCSNNTFPLKRIESNQHTAMDFWRECGNGEGWFALLINEETIMIPHIVMKAFCNSPYFASNCMSEKEIYESGVSLDKWVKKKCK